MRYVRHHVLLCLHAHLCLRVGLCCHPAAILQLRCEVGVAIKVAAQVGLTNTAQQGKARQGEAW